METKIDLDDLERVKQEGLSWYSKYYKNNDSFYAMATRYVGKQPDKIGNGKTIQLHRLIMNYYSKNDVDHHNHDTLDNTKDNLYIVDKNNNSSNRKGANKNNNTGVRNVSYIERDNVYWVQFMRKGKRFRWVFPSDQFKEACEFAEIKRKEIFGDFAGNE